MPRGNVVPGWLKTVVVRTVRSHWRDVQRRPGARGSGGSAVQLDLEQIEAPDAVDALVRELDDGLRLALANDRQDDDRRGCRATQAGADRQVVGRH